MPVAILQSSKLRLSVPLLSAFVVMLWHLLLPPALSHQLDDTALLHRAAQTFLKLPPVGQTEVGLGAHGKLCIWQQCGALQAHLALTRSTFYIRCSLLHFEVTQTSDSIFN